MIEPGAVDFVEVLIAQVLQLDVLNFRMQLLHNISRIR
jgi:hypothetical protein